MEGVAQNPLQLHLVMLRLLQVRACLCQAHQAHQAHQANQAHQAR